VYFVAFSIMNIHECWTMTMAQEIITK